MTCKLDNPSNILRNRPTRKGHNHDKRKDGMSQLPQNRCPISERDLIRKACPSIVATASSDACRSKYRVTPIALVRRRV